MLVFSVASGLIILRLWVIIVRHHLNSIVSFLLNSQFHCLNLANQQRKKLGVFGRKLEGSCPLFHYYLTGTGQMMQQYSNEVFVNNMEYLGTKIIMINIKTIYNERSQHGTTF